VDRVKHYINTHPDLYNDTSFWIEGMGWDQTRWESPQFPTAVSFTSSSIYHYIPENTGTQADLDNDPLLHGRPIALVRVDGHASWVSPRVLELMEPIPSTVEGGVIVRDAHGNPSGINSPILSFFICITAT
jgi:hypothetical protein